MLILFFLCSRSSGGTKGKNQKVWAPTPGFMTGYHKTTWLVRLILCRMDGTLGKTVSFAFPLEERLIQATEPCNTCGYSLFHSLSCRALLLGVLVSEKALTYRAWWQLSGRAQKHPEAGVNTKVGMYSGVGFGLCSSFPGLILQNAWPKQGWRTGLLWI